MSSLRGLPPSNAAAAVPRRRFLAAGLLLCLAPGGVRPRAAAPGSAKPLPAEAVGLTTYQLGPQIWVRWNNRLITCYRAHHSQKYPYLYPLCGPATGLSLSAETALPYPHHRSLFFACDRVNDGNYWQEGFDQGQILSTGPKLGPLTTQSVQILDACEWRKPGGPVVMTDQRRILVTVESERRYFVDWAIEWTAAQDAQVQKTNHSLFSLRAAADLTPDGGGDLLNAAGLRGEKDTFGKPAAWCGFYGQRAGAAPGVVEGIALLDHPANPWSACPWFTRDYGFVSPTPFNFLERPWELAAGKSITLRYRVVLHVGAPQDAGVQAVYDQWAARKNA